MVMQLAVHMVQFSVLVSCHDDVVKNRKSVSHSCIPVWKDV